MTETEHEEGWEVRTRAGIPNFRMVGRPWVENALYYQVAILETRSGSKEGILLKHTAAQRVRQSWGQAANVLRLLASCSEYDSRRTGRDLEIELPDPEECRRPVDFQREY
jgi:hypothetical protein